MDTKTTPTNLSLRLNPELFKPENLRTNQHRVSRDADLHYTTVRDYLDGTREAKIDLDVVGKLLAHMGISADALAEMPVGKLLAISEDETVPA